MPDVTPSSTAVQDNKTVAPAEKAGEKVYPDLPSDTVPEDYGKRDQEAKLRWLVTQRFSDRYPTWSLGKAYTDGCLFTKAVGIVDTTIILIIKQLAADNHITKTEHAAISFFEAWRKSMGHLSDTMAENLKSILKFGKVPTGMGVLQPVETEDFDAAALFKTVSTTPTLADDKTVWDLLGQMLELFVEKNKFLNDINPVGAVSYAELIKTCIQAGKDFFEAWRADPKARNRGAPVSPSHPPVQMVALIQDSKAIARMETKVMAISSAPDSDSTSEPLVTEFSNSVVAPKFEARRVAYAVPVSDSMEESHFALKVDDVKGGNDSAVPLITEDDRVRPSRLENVDVPNLFNV
ncbi:hypothetical protein QFC19_006741 [Naganishia cerealis]|uniref:Uncharacterized protein n=1 Tax=Naganishia cerealis TaxID=610337 RepID=A0ACC2VFX4_9TREE|nr:hypothetical protein QFC19_006741 [Naganishia cerealis]